MGIAFVSLPIGPYQTPDTQLEFTTVQGVLKWGYPYVEVKGNFIDVPPLGFYTEALFFQIFGSTIDNGITLITLFGLACVVVVYKLGREIYGKSTGLFAAAFFALSPWELVLTRAFLIDIQCLLLSLVCLYCGILAIRRDSVKLAVVSGIFFAAAFLTKQYAVFMLIPLLLLYIYHRPKNPKQILLQLSAFSFPAVFSNLYWYQIIMGEELLYLIQHNDFNRSNFQGVVPSYSFITNFLTEYGLGTLFFTAVVFSFLVGFLFWKSFSKRMIVFELICLLTVLCILGVNMYLGVNLNLKAPYTSAVKYSYQSLPFFSLIASSLAVKSTFLLKSYIRNSGKLKRSLYFIIGLIGLLLLGTPILENMITAQWLTIVSHLIFRVQPELNVGYSFVVLYPMSHNYFLLNIQFLGFMLVFFGLLWAGRHFTLEE